MLQYIGPVEMINLFVLPFVGLLLNLIWVYQGNKKDKQENK